MPPGARVLVVQPDPWTAPGRGEWVVHDGRHGPGAAGDRRIVVPPSWPAAPPAADPRPGHGAVVLLAPSDAWFAVDHSVEVLWRLAARLPGHPLRWVVRPGSRWLAEHDLDHTGLRDRVAVVPADDPEALAGAGAVVRAGYDPSLHAALAAAARAGVPVVGFRRDDTPSGLLSLRPLDVESVVEAVAAVVADPGLATRRGAAAALAAGATDGSRPAELLAAIDDAAGGVAQSTRR
jgi:hypothetical protein